MKAIVTVKLPRNPKHNPKDKQSGKCPVTGKWCTDVTGSHHSYVDEGKTVQEIYERAWKLHGHVTRVEEI